MVGWWRLLCCPQWLFLPVPGSCVQNVGILLWFFRDMIRTCTLFFLFFSLVLLVLWELVSAVLCAVIGVRAERVGPPLSFSPQKTQLERAYKELKEETKTLYRIQHMKTRAIEQMHSEIRESSDLKEKQREMEVCECMCLEFAAVGGGGEHPRI